MKKDIGGTEKFFIFFTHITEKYLLDKNKNRIGKIYDLIMRPTEIYPHVVSLVVVRGLLRRYYAVIPWEKIRVTGCFISDKEQNKSPVQEADRDEFYFTDEPAAIEFKEGYDSAGDMSLLKNILDKQIVDTYNRKVVRVNDIHMLKAENNFHIAHVDIGMRGLIRRLGAENFTDNLVSLFAPHAKYLTHDMLISWKHVQPLAIHPIKGTLSLNVSQNQLSTIPSGDLGDIITDLDVYERTALFKSIDTAMRVKIISGLELEMQKTMVENLEKKDIVEILNQLPSDMAVDLLGAMSENDSDELLGLVESGRAKKLALLLGHEENSAGGLMTTEFITLPADISVTDAIGRIRAMTGTKVETIYYAYIMDKDNRLTGMTTFRHLLLADPLKPINEIMIKRPISVHVADTARKVSFLFDKYGLLAIPVINQEHVMQGIITVDDILSHIIQVAYKKRVRKPKL